MLSTDTIDFLIYHSWIYSHNPFFFFNSTYNLDSTAGELLHWIDEKGNEQFS